MRITSLILLFSTLSYLGICQNKDNIIYWNKQRELIWADFQGIPDSTTKILYGTDIKAASAVQIGYNMTVDSSLNLVVFSFFDKKLSWTTDSTSNNLLKHEQLHFDISELYARKIRKEMNLYKKEKIEDYNFYEQKISKLLGERDSLDIAYDKETYHGVVDFIQEEWNEKIAMELNKLKEYAVNYDEYLNEE